MINYGNRKCIQYEPDIDNNYIQTDLVKECYLYEPLTTQKDAVADVPCDDGLLLRLLDEMKKETVEYLWDYADDIGIRDEQACQFIVSRLEDFFNSKIYEIKRKQ